MRGINDDEIPAFANLTIENTVHIRFIEFMPVDKSTDWNKNLFIPSGEIQEMLKRKWDIASDNSNNGAGPATMFQIRGARGKIGFISPLSNHFCSCCNRLRLTADGKLRTCLFSDNEIDLKTFLRDGCTDRVLEEKISEAILSKPERHEILEPTFKKCHRNMSAIGG
jgi:cyclic pyranopterin phosphate synthase